MGSQTVPEDLPYMEFDQFGLKLYTTSEIQKLAEVEIFNPETFDLLGHPLPNGLHDLKLGPTEYGGRCETCKQIAKYCPGHYGYIHLDVPVFHPVLFPFMFNLLKGSCIFCHRFMCNTSSGKTKILLAQLRCIELGCFSLAESLFYQIRDRVETAESKAENAAMLEVMSVDIGAIDEKLAKITGKTVEQLLAQKSP
uniref:DNA-directed RNA polymerase n=1 Tax=Panagrolaimus sp. JU765 TaxID=591449 RepID=A0AC34Q6R1_9BILA